MQTLTETEIHKLIALAKQAQEKAYAPYSRYHVGAALLCADGKIYQGVNIENVSYPAGICAERSAFAAAVSEGQRQFRAIAIAGVMQDGGDQSRVIYPCGICRQFMSELCDEAFTVIAADGNGGYRLFTLKELLPYSFRF